MKRSTLILIAIPVIALAVFFIIRRTPTPADQTPQVKETPSVKTTPPPPKPPAPGVERFLPETTVALFRMPNAHEFEKEMKSLEIYKLWQEPQVQALVNAAKKEMDQEKDKMPVEVDKVFKQLNEFWAKVKGEAFVSVSDLQPEKAMKEEMPFSLLVALEGGAELETLFGEILKNVPENAGLPAPSKVTFENVSYEVRQVPQKGAPPLCTGMVGGRFVVAFDEASMKNFILRSNGKTPQDADGKPLAALSANPRFQSIAARTAPKHSMFSFMDMHQFASVLRPMLEKMGNADAIKQMASLKSMSWTTSIMDGRVVDALHADMPEAEREPIMKAYLPLQNRTVAATGINTSFYMAQSFDMPLLYDEMLKQMQANAKNMPKEGIAGMPVPDPMAGFNKMNEEFQKLGVDIKKDIIANLGNEYAMIMDKPEALFPQLAGIIEVKNADGLKAALDKLVAAANEMKKAGGDPTQPEVVVEPFEDGTLYRIKAEMPIPFLTPTLYLGKKFFIFSLTETEAKTIVERLKTPHDTIEKRPGYKEAFARMPANRTVQMYFDMKDLVETYYPNIQAAAAVGMSKFKDMPPLPTLDTVLKHLTPVVMGTSLTKEGSEMRMESPAGLPAMILVPAIGAGAAGAAREKDVGERPRFD